MVNPSFIIDYFSFRKAIFQKIEAIDRRSMTRVYKNETSSMFHFQKIEETAVSSHSHFIIDYFSFRKAIFQKIEAINQRLMTRILENETSSMFHFQKIEIIHRIWVIRVLEC
jgi:uncharacterized protein YutE (UPF0331/DUF86 family)